MPLEQTYCQRVLDGRLPNLIPDVRGDDRAASLPITEASDVGAFASVPVVFSDGRFYGTLCAGSHDPKPDLGYRELRFLHVLARLVADVLEREELQLRTNDLEQTAHRLEVESTASSALLTAVQARDSYTADHSRAVVDAAEAVARRLALDEVANRRRASRGAPARHRQDRGSRRGAAEAGTAHGLGVGDDALHPVQSAEMVAAVPGLSHLAPMVRAEHERWDGTGYPDGLAGEEIPLASRITLVCDAYHAMTSDRPYRRALSDEAARAEVLAGLGTQFCPTAGRALLDTLAE